MRLIDADELVIKSYNAYPSIDHYCLSRKVVDISDIYSAPTIEAEPISHGHWDADADGYADGEPVYDHWFCSECGWDDNGFLEEKPNYKYCPRCGSKMDNAGGGK